MTVNAQLPTTDELDKLWTDLMRLDGITYEGRMSRQAADAIKLLRDELADVREQLEKANERIAIAFHPEIGWAVDPEYHESAIAAANADYDRLLKLNQENVAALRDYTAQPDWNDH